MSVFVCPSLYLEMWLSNWNGVCTKRCVIFRRCAAYRFWWDNWAIILIRSDLPLAFCSLTPACYFSVGRMGSLFGMSLKGESREHTWMARWIAHMTLWRVYDARVRFFFAFLWMKRSLKFFAKFLKSFRKWYKLAGCSGGKSYEIQNFDDVREWEWKWRKQ